MCSIKKIRPVLWVLLLAVCTGFYSCDKVDIAFTTNDFATDPNITYYDNYPVNISTYKADSFITTGHNVIVAGYHTDTALGILKAGAYIQLNLPATNPILNTNSSFDSLVLLLKPSGQFYGDSTRPVTLKIHQLTQNINSDAGDVYYNTSAFAYNTNPAAQKTITLNNTTGSVSSIRIADVIGQDWFNKFKSGDAIISSSEKFIDYFKGFYITADTMQSNTAAYFTAIADTPIVRLYYHENGLFATSKQLDFTYTATKTFNAINYRFTSPAFTALNSRSSYLLPGTFSSNKAVLNTAAGTVIKISFTDLLTLKELHPYVKIIKALLVIKPAAASTAQPYSLPGQLYLYQTDNSNASGTIITQTNADLTSTAQTGNLFIDYTYGESTNYTYDITNFINTKISEGEFSQSALLLKSSLENADAGLQRIFINNQNASKPIQLKLYVLGL